MLTLKFTGYAIMFLSALYCSYSLIKNANYKISQLEGLCAFILYTKNNIDSFMRPIDDIINSFDGYENSLHDFMETARKHGLVDASTNIPLSIGKEALHILRDFSKNIGNGYKEDELRLCAYTYSAMQEILNRERSDMMKKMKLYKTLPILSATSVVLLLS